MTSKNKLTAVLILVLVEIGLGGISCCGALSLLLVVVLILVLVEIGLGGWREKGY